MNEVIKISEVNLMETCNIRSKNICGFCKNWFDPDDVAIKPKDEKIGIWEYDENASNMCLKINLNRKSWNSCSKYQCKL